MSSTYALLSPSYEYLSLDMVFGMKNPIFYVVTLSDDNNMHRMRDRMYGMKSICACISCVQNPIIS